MKDKITEILKNKSKSLSETWVTENVILESAFNEVAEDIERLFFDGLSDELKERLEDHLKQLRQDQ